MSLPLSPDAGHVELNSAAPAPAPPPELLTETERTRLKNASTSGVAVNIASQLIRFVLRFGYQILIARLLVPRDFGLVAMAAPAVSFIQLFADLGLSQATVQQKHINQAQLSFLFWVNVAAGLLLAGICVLVAPAVAQFYGDPRVAGIMVVSGGLLFLSGLYGQHIALLNRHMRYTALAAVDIVSLAFGAAAGLISAHAGCGYWAIMINQAAASFIAMLIAWQLAGWTPGRPGKLKEMWPLLQFGGNITGFNILNFFSRNSDNILLGRFAGADALGFYDRARKLMLLPFGQVSQPFTAVALPLLSKTLDEPELYRRAYRRMLEAVLLLLYPGLAFMIVESHRLIVFALGARWATVAPIFAILGIDACVSPIGNSMGWLFVSQGRTRELRDWGIVSSILFVSCFVAGLHWGARGVAAGYATAGVLEIAFLWRFVTRKGPLRGRDFWALLLPFLAALAGTFAVEFLLRAALPDALFSLAVEALAAYASFALLLFIQPNGRQVLFEITGQMAGFISKRRGRG